MIAVPVDAGRRDESGQPIQELERGEPEHGAPVGRGPGQAIADLTLGLPVAPLEPLERERRPGAVAEQSLESGPVVGFDADRGVEGEASGVIPGEHVAGGVLLEQSVAGEQVSLLGRPDAGSGIVVPVEGVLHLSGQDLQGIGAGLPEAVQT